VIWNISDLFLPIVGYYDCAKFRVDHFSRSVGVRVLKKARVQSKNLRSSLAELKKDLLINLLVVGGKFYFNGYLLLLNKLIL
jgi:hypothetical protein